MPFIVVEYKYDPPLSDEQLNAIADRLSPCLDAHEANWVGTYVSEDRTQQICIFEAKDTESVRTAYRSANVKFARAWPAFAPFND